MGTIISSASAQTVKLMRVDNFTAVTGTTVRTISGSLLIPANTLVGGEILELTTRVEKTGTSSSYEARVFINNAIDINSPAQTLAFSPTIAAGSLSAQLERTIDILDNATAACFRLGSGSFTDSTSDIYSISNINVDWTVDQYIILAIQNGNSADSTIGAGMFLKIFK
jgi:hypothetical protein